MPRDDFFLSLQTAAGLFGPSTVEVVGGHLNGNGYARKLDRAAMWLNPKSIEGFESTDFADWPTEERTVLAEAVDRFREVATEVPEDRPATDEQYRTGRERLARVFEIVRSVELSRWSEVAVRLVEDAERWGQARGWLGRRQPKSIREPLLGKYDLPQLYLNADGVFAILDPIARYVVDATGLFQICLNPTLDRAARVVRHGDAWSVHFEVPHADRHRVDPWSERSFVDAINRLRQFA